MKLREWLKKNKMSQEKFSKLLKTDQAHISKLVNGKVRPTMDTMELIEAKTKNEVTLRDWML